MAKRQANLANLSGIKKPVIKRKTASVTVDEEKAVTEIRRDTAKKKEPTRRVTVDVPEGLHRALKILCLDKRMSMKDLLLTAAKEHFRDELDLG
jgi:hypothetical protein